MARSTLKLRASRSAAVLLPALMLLGGAGCVSTTVIQTGAVTADTAQVQAPEDELLDVGIAVFDPGLAAEGESDDRFVSDSVRQAEARYIPYVLSETMQRTGYWGAVRVIPAQSNSVDVTVTGEILRSDGERLVLQITASDATGRVWLDRRYEHLSGKLAYRESLNVGRLDPFQDLYNTIANDLAAAMREVPPEERETIRQVAELRFAEDLAPQAFGDYLRQEDGRYTPRRLPAYSDPMVARMRRIREREYFFFDTLDEHFRTFATEMDVPYDEWRKYTYDEVVTLRELQRQSLQHKIIGGAMIAGGIMSDSSSTLGNVAEWGAIVGGIAALRVGFDKGRQRKLHAAALEELNSSFEAEVEPLVMEIEGQTVTLQGSLESQFEEWRGILRDIYALENAPIASAAGTGGEGGASTTTTTTSPGPGATAASSESDQP